MTKGVTDEAFLIKKERKKTQGQVNPPSPEGNIQNRTVQTFPDCRTRLILSKGVVEEVTACSVGVGAACKAWGFPYFLLHVIIYFLKLNHALLMAPNATGNAAPSIITSLKRAKEKKNTPLTAVQATALMSYFKFWFSCIGENGYLTTSAWIM